MSTNMAASVQRVSSRSGAVPPSARRLALSVDSEDYAFEFLLDMPVSGIRSHAQVYAKFLVTARVLWVMGLSSPWRVSKKRAFLQSKQLTQASKYHKGMQGRSCSRRNSCTRYSFPNSLVEVVLGQSLQIRNRFAGLGQPSVLSWRHLLAGRQRRWACCRHGLSNGAMR